MLIFIYGEDSFSAKEKIKDLKKSFLEKSGSTHVSITDIDGDSFDLADFRNKAFSSGFFAEKKMIVIRDLFSNKDIEPDVIIELFGKIPEETSVIVWETIMPKKNTKLYKFFNKQKFVFNFEKLSNFEIIKWINERVKKYNCQIESQAVIYITDVLAGDLWKIDLELNKLCLHAQSSFVIPDAVSEVSGDPGSQEKKNEIASSQTSRNDSLGLVTEKLAKELLKKESEENIFKFIDALAARNKGQALELLKNEFDSGIHELQILGALAKQIKNLLQVKHILNSGESPSGQDIASRLDIHPFVAQKSLSQVNNFHINELKNIYRQLLQIDMSVKTSSAPPRALFDRMIAKL